MVKKKSAFKKWVLRHDDSWLFIGCYVSLAVVLSVAISLFWLLAVVSLHFLFEWIKQSELDNRLPGIFLRSLWEIKLDISLVVLALAIGVYMDLILGAAGLSGAARAGVQTGARFAGWHGVIKGIILSADDAAQLARVVLKKKSDGEVTVEDNPAFAYGGWFAPWSKGDWMSLSLGVISALLIVLAPVLTENSASETIAILLNELHPYPF
jgi:hypothetical protein